MLVYGRENSMPCDIMYSQTGAVYNRQHGCFCEYIAKLKTAYVHACQTMSIAANRQRVYHDEHTATCFFKPSDWVLYWNKPKQLQTSSCGWTGPYFMVEKVSPFDYMIQLAPDGKKTMVHCDELQMEPCNQDRPNWIKDELARRSSQGLDSSDSMGACTTPAKGAHS